MADTETILNDKTLSRADDQGKPDRAKSLALDAIDTAFQDYMQAGFKIAAENVGPPGPMGGLTTPEAIANAMAGYRKAKAIWLEFRKQINADGG